MTSSTSRNELPQTNVFCHSEAMKRVGGIRGFGGNEMIGGIPEFSGNETIGGICEFGGNETIGGIHEFGGNEMIGGIHEFGGNCRVDSRINRNTRSKMDSFFYTKCAI